MVVTDHTDPKIQNPFAEPPPRPVYFTLKSLLQITGVLTLLWGAIAFVFSLMFYPRSSGERTRTELTSHIEACKVTKRETSSKIVKLEEEDGSLLRAIHRIEMRQVEMAPRHIRGRLPPVPEAGTDSR